MISHFSRFGQGFSLGNRGLLHTRSRDFILLPTITFCPDVDIDGASRCAYLIWPPRCSLYTTLTFLPFQSELKKKSRMRAILQAIALPSKSVKKNIAEAEKQFQSKPSLVLPPSYQLQIGHDHFHHQYLMD